MMMMMMMSFDGDDVHYGDAFDEANITGGWGRKSHREIGGERSGNDRNVTSLYHVNLKV